jgi:hypothetical protein
MIAIAIVGMVVAGIVGIVAIAYGRRFSSRAHIHGGDFRMDIAREHGEVESSENRVV